MEARAGIEPTYEDLQSSAWPLCHRANMPPAADHLAQRRIEPSSARVKHAGPSRNLPGYSRKFHRKGVRQALWGIRLRPLPVLAAWPGSGTGDKSGIGPSSRDRRGNIRAKLGCLLIVPGRIVTCSPRLYKPHAKVNARSGRVQSTGRCDASTTIRSFRSPLSLLRGEQYGKLGLGVPQGRNRHRGLKHADVFRRCPQPYDRKPDSHE